MEINDGFITFFSDFLVVCHGNSWLLFSPPTSARCLDGMIHEIDERRIIGGVAYIQNRVHWEDLIPFL